MRANSITAIQAETIFLIFPGILMNYAGVEELLGQEGRKPLGNLRNIQLQESEIIHKNQNSNEDA